MVSTIDYPYNSWDAEFTDNVDIGRLYITPKWNNIVQKYAEHGMFKSINNVLTEDIQHTRIYPYPNLLFNTFYNVDIDEIKVVFVGQDPYFSSEIHNSLEIPQAMGAAFSIPTGLKIPSSLENIFSNQMKYGRIYKKQPHGNLQFWMNQGCFLLNTALTVRHGEPNSHAYIWSSFTNEIIKYISSELDGVVFVFWGAQAYERSKLIDASKHHLITSSHPSGKSCNTPFRDHPAFSNFDHFGEINKYLTEHDKSPICWQLF